MADIVSKPNTKEYRENYDKVFGHKKTKNPKKTEIKNRPDRCRVPIKMIWGTSQA